MSSTVFHRPQPLFPPINPHHFPQNPSKPSSSLFLLLLSPKCSSSSSSSSSRPSSPAKPPTTHYANTNHMIQSLCKQGHIKQALHALTHEPHPSIRTYESLILACAARRSTAAVYGRLVHRHLLEDGLGHDPFLCTRLVEMYAAFDDIDDARKVFDGTSRRTVFLWNAFLRALAMAGEGEEAMEVYSKMGRDETIEFDTFTYSYALKAAAASATPMAAYERIRRIHAHAVRRRFDSEVHVATTLVDVYAKLSRVAPARTVFDGMLDRNVVSWTAMIACYSRNEMHLDALRLFREMTAAGTTPNSVTMVGLIHACAGLSAMQLGRVVHCYVLRRRLDSIASVVNALIAMYVKCGSLAKGRRMFDGMGRRRDVVSWNTMVSGYGMYGHGKEALGCFQEMIRGGISPSPISFVSVLGACSHSGLVEEGKRLFNSISKQRTGFNPTVEHYASMVDLLGRAGRLEEARKMIDGMRIEPGPTTWGSLLGACKIHGNVELAERACKRLFKLEPTNAGNYVLLANIYADAGMWDKVTEVKTLIEAHGLEKMPGCSWIEVKGQLHSFVSVDEMNPQIEQLNAFLVRIVGEMKTTTGYVPLIKVVLYDLEDVEKERILLSHSEKLAVAFGLINTSNREVIRITKNLRLCEDCHSVTKFISKFANREIFVRDVNRIHHFKDGACSCGDYW